MVSHRPTSQPVEMSLVRVPVWVFVVAAIVLSVGLAVATR
jgi:hypothetical protein